MQALVDTLQSQKSVRREGYFQLFSVLSIWDKQLPGFQRVIPRPFPAKRYRGSNRQDLVFVRPPDAGKDFLVSINTVWCCRVLLLFSFYSSTDSGIKRNDCAFVSELWEYDKDPPGAKLCRICLNISNYPNFRCFGQSGSWPGVPASFMNVSLIIRCFTCSQWNWSSESCLSYQLATQKRFHTACGSTRRILSALRLIQERGPVTEAETGGSWAGRANAARNEEA